MGAAQRMTLTTTVSAIIAIALVGIAIGLKKQKALKSILLLIVIVGVFYLTLLNREYSQRGIILMPLWSYAKWDMIEIRTQILNNIILFVPVGALLCANGLSVKRSIFLGLALSITIETLQYWCNLGLCEIDDVMNNTMGTIIGCVFFQKGGFIVNEIESKSQEQTHGKGHVSVKMMNQLRSIYRWLSKVKEVTQFALLKLMPVKKNRILLVTMFGSTITDSPKYIGKYIEEHFPGQYELVWILQQNHTVGKRECDMRSITQFSKRYLYMTSGVIIENGGVYSTPRRKDILRINTWHGGGFYKKIEIHGDYSKYDYMLSSSRCFTENVLRRRFSYPGKVLECGLPRNDLLFAEDRSEVKRKICDEFHLSQDQDIILYAPTWRDKKKENIQLPDFQRLKDVYLKRFGKECQFLVRGHYWMSVGASTESVDVNAYPDTQELLMAADMVISDYSSIIWDFSLTNRPCFLFTPDLDWYIQNRGLESDIYSWGFPVCRTQDELLKAVESFDMVDFTKAMEMHHIALGSFETGHACEQVSEVIRKHVYGCDNTGE